MLLPLKGSTDKYLADLSRLQAAQVGQIFVGGSFEREKHEVTSSLDQVDRGLRQVAKHRQHTRGGLITTLEIDQVNRLFVQRYARHLVPQGARLRHYLLLRLVAAGGRRALLPHERRSEERRVGEEGRS